jgi:Family of unknown function (DUF5677)
MTFEFDADGFLTDRRGALEAATDKLHGALFARARQINRDCHELLSTADIRNRDVQQLLIAPLFVRALEHYQATLILLGTGLIAPARVLLRATVEAVFTMRAITLQEEALKDFINADLLWRRKMIKSAQQHHHTNLEELREAITPELIKSLEEQIKSSGAKALSAEKLSKLAGMHEWYTTHYALLSKATHTSVRELESYLSLDEAGEVRSLTYAPSMEDIPLLILTAAHCILLGAAAFAATFELDFRAKGDEHVKFIEAGFRSLNNERQ